jgi:acetyl-CoA carboxylase biotin carboxylase subunit
MKKHHTTITKVLIANRGEISRRVQRACRLLGIKTVAVASDVDQGAPFAQEADELVVIGAGPPRDSYLRVDRILAAAKQTGADAIHPGYGFLSENAEFAKAVEDAGLIFIGPRSDTISALGSKTAAKEIAQRAKVPFSPSTKGGLSDSELGAEAEKIGFPVLIKAVAGGGGRGMRLVQAIGELPEALLRARGEAQKFFGNGDVYLEKYIERPRHVEVQIFGDAHGNVVHLGTRDCSVQRRHQKLVEEAPAPCVSPKLREALHQAAVAIGRAAKYQNAGTVEFLVKGEEFYFLEVNTRIQVEHPVTEAITGIDLVRWQIEVAQGAPLPLKQSKIAFGGHAIEFRICAEDPKENFRPATGPVEQFDAPPGAEGIREDRGIERGGIVSPFYDSLISKVIVTGTSRAQVIDKSLDFLSGYTISPLPTTVAFHQWVLYNPEFRAGRLDIGYVEREFSVKKLLEIESLTSSLMGRRLRQSLRSGALEPAKLSNLRAEASITSGNLVGAHTIAETGFEGAIVENIYRYQSKKFDTIYTIEVLHKRDGFFVAVPVDSTGRRAKSQSCRMSNGLNTVVDSIINDVLEKQPPAEIFAA